MSIIASGLGALGSLLFCFGGMIGLDVITNDLREMHGYLHKDSCE